MIGLLAFIGLTVDAGILFIGVGHLRRAVDAAALAAAAQFREGRDLTDQEAAAREVIHLNGVEPSGLELRICAPGQPQNMPSLCPQNPGDPQRKLIYIQAKTKVTFAFLTIIGFHSTEIVADATSEAASVDVVLAIDTSDSMALTDKPTSGNPGCNAQDPTGADGFPGECHPFEEVKQAATSFVGSMYFPYDRVSVVTYDNVATVHLPLGASTDVTTTQNLIMSLTVSPTRNPGDPVQCVLSFVSNPPPTFDESVGGCTNTSIGNGLRLAGDEFGKPPVRQDSVWVVILLTDGAANASEPDPSNPSNVNLFCPPTFFDLSGNPFWQQPFCRDEETGLAFTGAHTRHAAIDPAVWGRVLPFNPYSTYDASFATYDADDYAATAADFVACAAAEGDAAEWCKDSLDYTAAQGGQGATIYAIGLGPLVTCIGSIEAGTCVQRNPSQWTQGRPDAGDRLLRYIANVGIDGDPNPDPPPGGVGITDPCLSVPVPYPLTPGNDSYNCGNYYFSETGAGLASVFESIASRVFTRLTQ